MATDKNNNDYMNVLPDPESVESDLEAKYIMDKCSTTRKEYQRHSSQLIALIVISIIIVVIFAILAILRIGNDTFYYISLALAIVFGVVLVCSTIGLIFYYFGHRKSLKREDEIIKNWYQEVTVHLIKKIIEEDDSEDTETEKQKSE